MKIMESFEYSFKINVVKISLIHNKAFPEHIEKLISFLTLKMAILKQNTGQISEPNLPVISVTLMFLDSQLEHTFLIILFIDFKLLNIRQNN